jgi:fibronectin-binding autotransporter adhesin
MHFTHSLAVRLVVGFFRPAAAWAVAVLVLGWASLTQAQTTVYWDTNSTTAGTGTAGGTWDQNTTSDWTTDSTGVATTAKWQSLTSVNGGIATFAAGTNATGSYTVTGSGTITGIKGITFEEGTVTLSGGTLTLAADSNINTNASNASISSVITGGFGITKLGSGTLTLSGTNTYTGTTNIGTAGGVSGGTLAFGAASVLPSTTVTVFAGTLNVGTRNDSIGALVLGGGASGTTASVTGSTGVLTLGGDITYDATNNPAGATISAKVALGGNRTITVGSSSGSGGDDLSITGVVSGTGFGITKSGAGTLSVGGTNTYTGNTTVSQGTLQVDATAASNSNGPLGKATTAVVVNDANTGTNDTGLVIGTTGVSIGRKVTVANAGTGTVTLGGSSALTSGTGTFNNTITLNKDANLNADGTAAITFSGQITGTGNITKTGTGNVTLSSTSNNYGATTIGTANGANAGTLALGASSVLSGNALTIFGGNLSMGAFNDTVTTLTLGGGAGASTATINGTGTLTLGGGVTYNATNNPGGATIGANLALGGNRTFTIDSSSGSSGADLSISGVVSGTGFGITKTGAGTMVVSGTNTYTGTNIINGGTVQISTDRNLGAVPGVVTANSITLGGGTLQTTANATLSSNRGTTLTAATDSNIIASTGTTLTYGGIITGAGNIHFGAATTGTGTVALSGTSNFTGTSTITAGAVNATNNNSLSTTNVTVSSGSTLQLQGNGLSLGSGSSTVTISGAGTGAGGNNGALINVGGATTRLNNNVALAADATISSGATSGATLIVGGTPPAYTPGVSAPDTNTLALGTNNLTFVGAASTTTQVDTDITGTGNITVNTSGTVHYNANKNTYTGTTAVTNGTLLVDTADNDFAPHSTSTSFWGVNGPLVIGDGTGAANSAMVQLGATGSPGVTNDALNSTAALTINSDGYLNLNGNAQNFGQLTMSGGKIDSGTGGTAYLDFANTAVTINPTSTSGTATINGTLSLTYWKDAATEGSNPNLTRTFTVNHDSSNTSDLTINAVMGNGGLIKNGAGTMTLATSNNTYSASTTINNGILNVQVGTENVSGAHRSSLGSGDNDNSTGAGTTVNSGGTLQMQGGIAITNEQLTLNGAGFDPGTGALGALNNLSGSNTWGGGAGTGTIALGSDSTITSTSGLLTINATMSSASGTGYGLTVDGAGNTTISSSINTGSTGTVTKTGSGTLTLAGNSGYSGATYVTQGVTSVQNNGALGFVTTGTSGTFVNSGAELQLSNAASGNLTIGGESLVLNGAGIGGTSGALHNVAGNNTYGGQIRVGEAFTAGSNNYSAAAATIMADTGTTLTLSGGTTSANNLGLTVAGAGNTTISGNMSNGTGSLTKTGSGTLAITGTSATVGQVHLNQGTISVGGSTTLGTKEFDATAGTTLVIASGGSVVANYGTGTTTYFSGAIDGTGGGTFEKDGAGTLVFDHTFNAGTSSVLVLNGGTLSLGKNSLGGLVATQITFGTIHITGNTVLDFNSSADTFLTSNSLIIDSGVTVTVQGWISSANTTTTSTIWYANTTVNGQTLGGTDLKGGTPLSQVSFADYPGMTTTWVSGSHDGWFDHEIRPTPEPATYGAILLSGCFGLLGWRRYRRRHAAAAV